MEIEEARDFLRRNHRSVMATLRGDGRPQMSPVGVGVDADGMAIVSTRETAMKTHNLRRDPRCWLVVLTDGFFGRWVAVEGRATIVSLPEAMEGLVDYYRRLSGEHPDWDDYRAAMVREKRCLLWIAIERAGPDRSG